MGSLVVDPAGCVAITEEKKGEAESPRTSLLSIEVGPETWGKLALGDWSTFPAGDTDIDTRDIAPNQCCVLQFGEKSISAIFKKGDVSTFVRVAKPQKCRPYRGIKPLNIEEAFAKSLIVDLGITTVILDGPGGSGKTLTALNCGLELLNSRDFQQMIIVRATYEMGRKGIGFLPGGPEEKMKPWARAVADNYSLMMEREDEDPYDSLLRDGRITIEPLDYFRGRSIHHALVIIDDAQNIEFGEMHTLLTRPAASTKTILTGCLNQVDNKKAKEPKWNNGFRWAIEEGLDEPNFGYVYMPKIVRSEQAAAAERMHQRWVLKHGL